MDTIPRSRVIRALDILGINADRVQEVLIDSVAVRETHITHAITRLSAHAAEVLGFQPEDVLTLKMTHDEIVVTLIERDEHGNPIEVTTRTPYGNPCKEFLTRTEVCSVA